jgi:DNA-binding NarL/FixJ family response regulator
MPVMDGIQTLPEIKKRYPDLKVIILSMHNSLEMVTKLMALGGNSYLTKNSSSETIYKAIKCVLQYEYYYSDAIAAALINSDKSNSKSSLSEKELQLLSLLKANRSEKEIASIMDLGERTIFAIIDKLKMKTGTKTKAELLEYDINKQQTQS